MENRINIAELLKDCPKGMELDCTIWDNDAKVFLKEVLNDNFAYPIVVTVKFNNIESTKSFAKYGALNDSPYSKCVIFPKGKTTWEGFVPPCKFKDGDILYVKAAFNWICIYKESEDAENVYKYVAVLRQSNATSIIKDTNCLCYRGDVSEIRLATKEEKKKLFDTIKANGYEWNSETKTLEKLIEPKFKIGDRIRIIGTTGVYVVTEVREHYYIIDDKDMRVYFTNQDQWELALNKFDITTLKSFESRVLVRDTKTETWKPAYWGFYDETNNVSYPYVIVGGILYGMSIPYENNEHLLGTTDDCDEFYKTW